MRMNGQSVRGALPALAGTCENERAHRVCVCVCVALGRVSLRCTAYTYSDLVCLCVLDSARACDAAVGAQAVQ